jgi:hypothetical protein
MLPIPSRRRRTNLSVVGGWGEENLKTKGGIFLKSRSLFEPRKFCIRIDKLGGGGDDMPAMKVVARKMLAFLHHVSIPLLDQLETITVRARFAAYRYSQGYSFDVCYTIQSAVGPVRNRFQGLHLL